MKKLYLIIILTFCFCLVVNTAHTGKQTQPTTAVISDLFKTGCEIEKSTSNQSLIKLNGLFSSQASAAQKRNTMMYLLMNECAPDFEILKESIEKKTAKVLIDNKIGTMAFILTLNRKEEWKIESVEVVQEKYTDAYKK